MKSQTVPNIICEKDRVNGSYVYSRPGGRRASIGCKNRQSEKELDPLELLPKYI